MRANLSLLNSFMVLGLLDKEVEGTWNLILGKSRAELRKNPRKSWYKNGVDFRSQCLSEDSERRGIPR